MALYLNTRGRARLTIGICDRCRRKFPIGELRSDPNAPGLKVCAADIDDIDPFRLAPRQPDDITPPFVRKDVNIALDGAGNPVIPDTGGAGSVGGTPGDGALVDAYGNPLVLDQGTLG